MDIESGRHICYNKNDLSGQRRGAGWDALLLDVYKKGDGMMKKNNVPPMDGAETVQMAPETKKGKSGIKGILIAVAAVVIAAAAVAVAVGLSAASSPLNLIGIGMANSAKALSESDASVFWGKVAKGGSVELSYGMDEMDLPVDVDASLKLYTAAGKATLVADVRFDGESLIDASVFMDKENVAVASQLLFGKREYGVSLVDFEERFNNSVFGPGGAFSLGIEMPTQTDAAADKMDALIEDGMAVRETAASQVAATLKEHAHISKKKTTVAVNGADVPVTGVNMTVSGEAVAEVMIDLLEYLQSDTQLKEFFYDYADYAETAMMDTEVDNYAGLKERIDEFYAQLEEIDDAEKADLRESAAETGAELILTCYITKSGKELIGMDFVCAVDEEKVRLSFLAGPTWKKLSEISFQMEADGERYNASYAVDRDDEEEYCSKLMVHENGETLFAGTFEWDKEHGDFAAEMTDSWGDIYGATGSVKVDGHVVGMTVDSVYDDYGESTLDLSLVVDAFDMMPEMPVYADLLAMDEDEVENLLYSIEDTLELLSYLFY